MCPPSFAESRPAALTREAVPDPIRVVVVDDHEILRQTIRELLAAAPDMEWVGEARGGSEAVDLVTGVRPDVVLMDLSMPGTDGLQATQAVTSSCPGTRVLVLTSSTDPAHVEDSLRAGAVGVLPKDGDPTTILSGIRSVIYGEASPPAHVLS